MDHRSIVQFLGKIALVQGIILLIPLGLACVYGEPVRLAFALSIGINGAAGGALLWYGRKRVHMLTLREGLAITGLGWLTAVGLGMFPYMLSGMIAPLDCLFESISGFTGTGATVLENIESMPQSLLLWRSMTHWLGGLGILVIFVALLPESGQFWSTMYQAEMTGPTKERVLPRLAATTRALFFLYMGATAAACIAFLLCGMNMLEAVNHALSTVSAGGFSTYNDSAAHFNSPAVEYVMAGFMIFTGGNFNLYFMAYKKGLSSVWHNTEYKAYLSILAVSAFLITVNLCSSMSAPAEEALRYSIFQAASAATTGLVAADYEQWPPFSQLLMLGLMLTGGCAGSTAAGLKVSRVIIMGKTLWALVDKTIHPRMVLDVRMNGVPVSAVTIRQVFQFFFIYIVCIFLWSSLLIGDGIPVWDAVSISISAMGCIGPAFGTAGAAETYAALSGFSKGVLCVAMLMGRLEMMTFLVMMKKKFWTSGSSW